MRERDLLALVAIVVIVLAFVAMAGGGGGMMGQWMMGPWMGGGWMGFGMILLWVLIGAGVYLLLVGYTQPTRGEEDRALAIVGERYARGEITREEYEEIKRTLSRR